MYTHTQAKRISEEQKPSDQMNKAQFGGRRRDKGGGANRDADQLLRHHAHTINILTPI